MKNLQQTSLEQSSLNQQQQIILNDFSDLNAEYNKALIELQNSQIEKVDLESQLKKLSNKLILREEDNFKYKKELNEKEKRISLLERDLRNLQSNFMYLKEKNSNLNLFMNKEHFGNSFERDSFKSNLDKSKDLSKEIENKINSVKNFMGTSF